MARTTFKIFFGFLSTAGFVAAFALAGDVLLAALAAVSIVIVQFVFGQTTQAKPGALMWVSLALVIGLTSLSLRGDDSRAIASPAKVSTQTDCACKPQAAPTRATAGPAQRISATLALAARDV